MAGSRENGSCDHDVGDGQHTQMQAEIYEKPFAEDAPARRPQVAESRGHLGGRGRTRGEGRQDPGPSAMTKANKLQHHLQAVGVGKGRARSRSNRFRKEKKLKERRNETPINGQIITSSTFFPSRPLPAPLLLLCGALINGNCTRPRTKRILPKIEGFSARNQHLPRARHHTALPPALNRPLANYELKPAAPLLVPDSPSPFRPLLIRTFVAREPRAWPVSGDFFRFPSPRKGFGGNM